MCGLACWLARNLASTVHAVQYSTAEYCTVGTVQNGNTVPLVLYNGTLVLCIACCRLSRKGRKKLRQRRREWTLFGENELVGLYAQCTKKRGGGVCAPVSSSER